MRQKSDSLGESHILDRGNGEGDGPTSSCVWVRGMGVYEGGGWGPVSMHVRGDRDGLPEQWVSNCGHQWAASWTDTDHAIRCALLWCMLQGGSAVVDLNAHCMGPE